MEKLAIPLLVDLLQPPVVIAYILLPLLEQILLQQLFHRLLVEMDLLEVTGLQILAVGVQPHTLNF
jgi:hypothetical protein